MRAEITDDVYVREHLQWLGRIAIGGQNEKHLDFESLRKSEF